MPKKTGNIYHIFNKKNEKILDEGNNDVRLTKPSFTQDIDSEHTMS